MGRIFFTILLVFLALGLFAWQAVYWPADRASSQEVVFEVRPGEGAREIANHLEEQGLIRYDYIFRIYVFLSGDARRLKAGPYELSPSMTVSEIVKIMARGETAKVRVTIPEGFKLTEIEELLNAKFKRQALKPQLKTQTLAAYRDDYKFLDDAPADKTLEGFLFPDTYEFEVTSSSEELVRRMLENFDERVSSALREEIRRQGKTIFEIVTMASLLEKEVRELDDKKVVSGILWKRLGIGMALQVDATISYITGKKTTRISREETKIDNPYNTYYYPGLPPGPIANPGLESIEAAVYPEPSAYWFYLTTPEGETIFSRTLKEHNIAKARYLK